MIRRVLGLGLMVAALSLPMLRADERSVESLAMRWAPPPSEFIDLGGQLLHLRDEGPRTDPAPLLMLHGAASSLHSWEGWARALRGQRRVVRIDLPGFGLTGPFSGPYAGRHHQAPEMARFVLDVMARLKLERVVLVGHGLGGEVAWRLAAQAPQRVDRLVLLAPTGLRVAPTEEPLAWQLARLPVVGDLGEWLLPRALVRQALKTAVVDMARLKDAQPDRYYELALRSGNRAALVSHLRGHDWRQGLPHVQGVQAPTLLVWGTADRWVPVAAAAQWAADIPGAQVARVDGVGHLAQEEDPARSVAPVKAFLGLGG